MSCELFNFEIVASRARLLALLERIVARIGASLSWWFIIPGRPGLVSFAFATRHLLPSFLPSFVICWRTIVYFHKSTTTNKKKKNFFFSLGITMMLLLSLVTMLGSRNLRAGIAITRIYCFETKEGEKEREIKSCFSPCFLHAGTKERAIKNMNSTQGTWTGQGRPC